MKKIYEFLLWNNCNNNCTFCHQRSYQKKCSDKILNPQEQIESINECKNFLKTEFEKGNHILLVGGEIFDTLNEKVQESLKSLFDQVISQMLSEEIDLLYLNTNLLYQNTDLLYYFLDRIDCHNLFNRLHFTTSYDIKGRFNCQKSEMLFYKNLKTLTDTYKDIKVIVNTVLTNNACKRICEDWFGADFLLEHLKNQEKTQFTIKDWIDYFRVDINTIPYIKLDSEEAPEMPTRNTVFETLLHIDTIIPGYLETYANNISLKQEKLLFEYNKTQKKYIYCSSKNSDCGHSENFKLSFSDSDKCFPCEVKKLLNYKA